MAELKQIVAQNITALRRGMSMTQAELAEKLSYTDKAVSKWERGESVPDVTVLKAIADLFGVGVDYLLEEEHTTVPMTSEVHGRTRKRNRVLITFMSIILVWLVATCVFSTCVMSDIGGPLYLSFIYAVPISAVVWLVFNTIWFSKKINYLIISFLMWTTLVSMLITLYVAGINGWLIIVPGIPGQIIIALWSSIKRY